MATNNKHYKPLVEVKVGRVKKRASTAAKLRGLALVGFLFLVLMPLSAPWPFFLSWFWVLIAVVAVNPVMKGVGAFLAVCYMWTAVTHTWEDIWKPEN